MIQIGNQSSCWTAEPAEPFDYALASGFDAFEWFPDKKPDAGWDDSDLDSAKRLAIREAAASHHMRLSVHARWQANPLQAESHALLLKDLELAIDLGAVLFNVHLYHEAGMDLFLKALSPWLKRTADAGLQLSIENTPLHAPELFNELFARLRQGQFGPSDHAGMCLDLGHANLCSATRNDYLGFVDRLAPDLPINHLHLHENWGDADSHLTLFTGPAAKDDSGIRGLAKRLHTRRFSGSIILEQWPHPASLLNQARERLLLLLADGVQPAPRSRAGKGLLTPALSSRGGEGGTARPIEFNAHGDSFLQQLVAGNQDHRSWRAKLALVSDLLAEAGDQPFTAGQLADVAIYLRFLSTGEIPCQEDGRHFRPAHHARLALQIQEQLARHSTPDTAWLVRRIYPWLPSSARQFQRAEPLTRIRDIAHRNDIPQELKRELKHSLQNKLHRCAGPEDLKTSAALLERITAPDAGFSPDFVQQFKLFHDELKEFFNAPSLAERLSALRTSASDGQAELLCAFLEAKARPGAGAQTEAFDLLTQLRRSCLDTFEREQSENAQEFLLADIALEDYAFVLLSELANALSSPDRQPEWGSAIDVLRLTLSNLRLSNIAPEECHALESELSSWKEDFIAADRETLLRLKATTERSRRVAEDYSDRLLALLPGRVEALGQALGVEEHSIRAFCEGEIRGHLVFQLSRIASDLLRQLRARLALPAWDLLVAGRAVGVVKTIATISDLTEDVSEPAIALLDCAEGDEEIPKNIVAIVLGHEIPHLSHLGVRARQAGVVFLSCEQAATFAKLRQQVGQVLSLTATAETVEWHELDRSALNSKPEKGGGPVQVNQRKPVDVPTVNLELSRPWLKLEEVTPETGGGKACGALRLARLALKPDAGFRTPPSLVIPFAAMAAALASRPDLAARYHALCARSEKLVGSELEQTAAELRALVLQLKVAPELVSAVQSQFHTEARLMVRSSANCEDLPEFASAGLYETVANVAPQAAAAAVRTVWSSLWNSRAALSRQQAGIPHEKAHMAVLIQQMATPDYSFVLHTVNPLTGARQQAYIEMAVGLGETLARAAARGTPYRFAANKESGASTTLSFANFSAALVPAPGAGVSSKTLDYSQVELTRSAAFRRSLVTRLARLAAFVEQACKYPQDIEGAVTGQDVFLVQARPQQGLDKTRI